MKDDETDVQLIPYDRREALYQQLVDVTHILGEKVKLGLSAVRKYPPAALTRSFKAYATTVIELARDARQAQGATAADRKPVYALSEAEFAAEMQSLTRHVIRSMPREEVLALVADPVYAGRRQSTDADEREQGDERESESNEAEAE